MRVMARISIPVEAGNKGIASGALPRLIQEAAKRWSPEAMYFTTFDGRRTAFVVLDMADSSAIPAFAEPFFNELNAEVELAPTMNVEDLQKGFSNLG
jgi:hypothetical protein